MVTADDFGARSSAGRKAASWALSFPRGSGQGDNTQMTVSLGYPCSRQDARSKPLRVKRIDAPSLSTPPCEPLAPRSAATFPTELSSQGPFIPCRSAPGQARAPILVPLPWHDLPTAPAPSRHGVEPLATRPPRSLAADSSAPAPRILAHVWRNGRGLRPASAHSRSGGCGAGQGRGRGTSRDSTGPFPGYSGLRQFTSPWHSRPPGATPGSSQAPDVLAAARPGAFPSCAFPSDPEERPALRAPSTSSRRARGCPYSWKPNCFSEGQFWVLQQSQCLP